jgi:hypothetical protein
LVMGCLGLRSNVGHLVRYHVRARLILRFQAVELPIQDSLLESLPRLPLELKWRRAG